MIRLVPSFKLKTKYLYIQTHGQRDVKIEIVIKIETSKSDKLCVTDWPKPPRTIKWSESCRRRVLESQKENPLAASKIRFQEATKSQIDALRDVALLPHIREFQKRCKFWSLLFFAMLILPFGRKITSVETEILYSVILIISTGYLSYNVS